MCVHVKNNKNSSMCTHIFVSCVNRHMCAHVLYYNQFKGTEQQPGEPKAPNTSSHIPVRIAIGNINSQEDA